jgi:hypothetical protein
MTGYVPVGFGPGDSIIVNIECGLCGVVAHENMTEFYKKYNLQIVGNIVCPEAMDEFIRRRGYDLILGREEIILRCDTCKKNNVISKQQMVTISKAEYERLLEIEKKYKESEQSKNFDDQVNPEGGW